jgi:hypothetical protein
MNGKLSDVYYLSHLHNWVHHLDSEFIFLYLFRHVSCYRVVVSNKQEVSVVRICDMIPY